MTKDNIEYLYGQYVNSQAHQCFSPCHLTSSEPQSSPSLGFPSIPGHMSLLRCFATT